MTSSFSEQVRSEMGGIVGISCDSHNIYLAVALNDEILSGLPERITTPAGLEEHSRLPALLDEVDRAFDLIKPDRVVIVPPEQTYTAPHSTLTPRIARETIVRLAATKRSIDTEVLSRASIRAKLGLPRKGSLDSHLAEAVPNPVGQYWKSGRGVAAMAALAGGKSYCR